MNAKKMGMALGIAVAGAATTVAVVGGVANAAPTGGSANDTINQLQSQGSNVVVNKVGSGPMELCSVTSVRQSQAQRSPTANPLTGIPNFNRANTVHVGLMC